MIRVVFETRRFSRGKVIPITCVEVLPRAVVDLEHSTINGTFVNIVKATLFDVEVPKTTKSVLSTKRRSYPELRTLLAKHFRRSKWRLYVQYYVENLIADLDWEVVLAEGGYKTKPFRHHWERFIAELNNGLWVSPPTRRIVNRLKAQPWLQPYQEGYHDAKVYSRRFTGNTPRNCASSVQSNRNAGVQSGERCGTQN